MPIVVALNKIDLPNVNLNKIYGELSQQDLVPEEYGGDTPVVKTSALTGQGIPELLEMLEIVAELRCDLKANPTRPATGTCLEASISEGRGVVATVLVQDGTLKVGDVMVCGDGFGRVRALFDDKGRSVTEAGPVDPRRGLRARRRADRRREVRRRRRHLPRPRDRRDPPAPDPRRRPRRAPGRSRWRTSTARWPSRRSRAST